MANTHKFDLTQTARKVTIKGQMNNGHIDNVGPILEVTFYVDAEASLYNEEFDMLADRMLTQAMWLFFKTVRPWTTDHSVMDVVRTTSHDWTWNILERITE